MTTVLNPPGADELRERLAYHLAVSGAITSLRWRDAFQTVPRDVFIPDFITCGADGTRNRFSAGDPAGRQAWLEAVYSDDSLITQQDGNGTPTSSSSQPSLMATMLEMLDVDGGTVLEIGTGTGYNAALLCHVVGDQQVTSVDVDPELVDIARGRLETCGYQPTLAVGDGLAGWPGRAPYDRILATCGVRRIPAEWLAQIRPGGVIVANVGRVLVALQVAPDGYASGRFAAAPAGFMPARPIGAAPAPTPAEIYDTVHGNPGTMTRPTGLYADMFDPEFLTVADLTSPGLHAVWSEEDNGWYAVVDGAGSWARADGPAACATVTQAGPRRLWDEMQRAHDWWVAAGRPAHDRLGLTAGPDGQHTLWVGQPGQSELALP